MKLTIELDNEELRHAVLDLIRSEVERYLTGATIREYITHELTKLAQDALKSKVQDQVESGLNLLRNLLTKEPK